MRQFSARDLIEPPDVSEPKAPETISEVLRKELTGNKLVMSLHRLLGNGMEYADAVAMHRMADRGIAWADAGEWLGERNRRRAQVALQSGHVLTARSLYRYASACFRFGQLPLSGQDERKRSMYRKLIETFGEAGTLDNPAIQKVEIPYRNAHLCGWLMLPSEKVAPPLVIVMGGFDGWREEYHNGAHYLVERGLAVLLIEAPGQGETGLFHHLYLTADVEDAFAHIVNFMLLDARVGSRIGIWGNSFGGLLAAHTVSVEQRIQACCINGSPVSPIESLEHMPPLVERAAILVGSTDLKTVLDVIRDLSFTPEKNHIQCALLQLHGALDPLCAVEVARSIYEDAPSADKQLIVWQDGDHCIYNHSHEKHTLVADWFHDRLCG